MSENTTDTPITDKCRQQMAEKGWTSQQPVWGLIYKMEKIERQLAEAQEERNWWIDKTTDALAQVGVLTEQRDRLVEALRAYRKALSGGPENCSYNRYEIVDLMADDALASLNQPGEKP
jgi:uncharacterized coiled-coil DUF342 family protein